MASTTPVSLARRIVRDLMIYTRGQQQRWVPVETIERRLLLKDEKATDAALALAIEKADHHFHDVRLGLSALGPL